jgi:hypothetical protein
MNFISKKTLYLLIAIGLVTFVLGLVFAGFAPELFDPRNSPGTDSYSHSLVGHRAFRDWLEAMDIATVTGRNPEAYRLDPSTPILIIEPEVEAPPSWVEAMDAQDLPLAKFERLLYLSAEHEVPLLVVLPKWDWRPSFKRAGWIASKDLLPPDKLEGLIDRLSHPDEVDKEQSANVLIRTTSHGNDEVRDGSAQKSFQLAVSNPLQLIGEADWFTSLLSTPDGMLLGQVVDMPWYILSDPDIINNSGLAKGEHAEFMYRFLYEQLLAEGVIIDESVHGYRSQGSVLKRAFSFPWILLSLHVFFLLALVVWSTSLRFGKPIPLDPVLPPGKQLLLENTARLLLWAGDHKDAFRRYLQTTTQQVCQRFGLKSVELEDFSRRRGLQLKLSDIRAKARSPSFDRAQAVALARQLARWKRALLENETILDKQ